MRALIPSSAILSLLLHGLIVLIVGFTFVSCTGAMTPSAEEPAQEDEVIKATMLTEEEAMRYYEHKRQKEEALRRLRAEKAAAEKKRKELERARKKAQQMKLQERKRAEQLRIEEQKRAAQEAKKRAEELRREALRKEEAARMAREEELRRAEQEALRKAELERLNAEHQEKIRMRKLQIRAWTRQYIGMLRGSVEARWKKPPASIKGGECVVRVRQEKDGTIVDVKVVSCAGDKLYRLSVVEAVWKANPLPAPPADDVFDAEIELTFKQEYGG